MARAASIIIAVGFTVTSVVLMTSRTVFIGRLSSRMAER
jgi:hypothetical protein